ncbi:MAG: glycosyltransferase family 2 protein [Gemmatimonadetes bacterium]|nr:glycosyltransferase family 2 protein [Gemmatimonadota bacterium]
MSPDRPDVSAIVVSFNTRELTLAALASVEAQEGVRTETWVVDNASSDGTADAVRRGHPSAHLLALEENVGFGRANNLAMERAAGRHLLLLNSDARFAEPGGLRRLVDALEAEADVGVVGPRLESPAGRLEYSARRFAGSRTELLRRTPIHRVLAPRGGPERLLGDAWPHDRRRDVDWLTGACLLVRRGVVEDAGGFDPAIFMYGEEQEWCWRVRKAGWRVVFDPFVTVVHLRGASSLERAGWRARRAVEGDRYMIRRHRGALALAAFDAARGVALATEWLVHRTLDALRPSDYHRARWRDARLLLGAWWGALRGSAEP